MTHLPGENAGFTQQAPNEACVRAIGRVISVGAFELANQERGESHALHPDSGTVTTVSYSISGGVGTFETYQPSTDMPTATRLVFQRGAGDGNWSVKGESVNEVTGEAERIPEEYLQGLVAVTTDWLGTSQPISAQQALELRQNRPVSRIGGKEAERAWASINEAISSILLKEHDFTTDGGTRMWLAEPIQQSTVQGLPVNRIHAGASSRFQVAQIIFSDHPFAQYANPNSKLYASLKRRVNPSPPAHFVDFGVVDEWQGMNEGIALGPDERKKVLAAIAEQVTMGNLRTR